MGFITKDFTVEIDGRTQPLVAVYVPTNHLYMGDIFLYHRDAVIYPDISVQDGVRIFLTGGMAIADRLEARASAAAGDTALVSGAK
jgi:uncharacterized membrane protein